MRNIRMTNKFFVRIIQTNQFRIISLILKAHKKIFYKETDYNKYDYEEYSY